MCTCLLFLWTQYYKVQQNSHFFSNYNYFTFNATEPKFESLFFKSWMLTNQKVFKKNWNLDFYTLKWCEQETFLLGCFLSFLKRKVDILHTQNMTNPTNVSPVKMEYGWNFNISNLKMMMKSGLGKIFLKFLHALTMLFLLLNLYFWSKFLLFLM